MLSSGYPSICVNNSGVLCIELIVGNLPSDTAWMALDQYMEVDKTYRKEIYHVINFHRQHISKTGSAVKQHQPRNLLEVGTL